MFNWNSVQSVEVLFSHLQAGGRLFSDHLDLIYNRTAVDVAIAARSPA